MAAGIAHGEEAETEHPGQHGDEHHVLDTVPSQEEGYQQDAQGLGNLGEGYQHIGVLHSEGALIFRQVAEVGQERIREAVGNLQGHPEQHREDEEHRHLPLPEEREGPQSHGIHQRLLFRRAVDGTLGQGQGIESQQDAQYARNDILHRSLLHRRATEVNQVHEPHRAYKAHRTPDPDRRKVLDRILAGLLQDSVGHRVGYRDSRHEKSYADGIQTEQSSVLHRIAGRDSVDASSRHRRSRHQMTDTQKSLRRNPFVGDNTHDSGHEDRDNALNGIEHSYLLPETDTGQIPSLAGQISAPDSELQKAQNYQSYFISFHTFSVFRYSVHAARQYSRRWSQS